MKLDNIHNCTDCPLFKNQRPLIDKKRASDIMWVGLSAVKVSDLEDDIPLSEKTKSGQLIKNIESEIPELLYYRTNLVKCLPVKKWENTLPHQRGNEFVFSTLVH